MWALVSSQDKHPLTVNLQVKVSTMQLAVIMLNISKCALMYCVQYTDQKTTRFNLLPL